MLRKTIMGKNKEIRVSVTLECGNCAQNKHKRLPGTSRYITQKNRRNTPKRLELKKFCPLCCAHVMHKEIKKQ